MVLTNFSLCRRQLPKQVQTGLRIISLEVTTMEQITEEAEREFRHLKRRTIIMDATITMAVASVTWIASFSKYISPK